MKIIYYLPALFFLAACATEDVEPTNRYDVKIKVDLAFAEIEEARLKNDEMVDNGVYIYVSNGKSFEECLYLESLGSELKLNQVAADEHTLRVYTYVNEEKTRIFQKEITFNPAINPEITVTLEDKSTRFTFTEKELTGWPSGYDSVRISMLAYDHLYVLPNYLIVKANASFRFPDIVLSREQWENPGFFYSLPFEIEELAVALTGPAGEAKQTYYFASNFMQQGPWLAEGKSYTLKIDLQHVTKSGAGKAAFHLADASYEELDLDVF